MFVRWDEQRVENDLRLPGVGDGTVVRTFDAPEAMGINFHEVRARSALNHVPGGRYGFSWTVNPYRGCSHACTYCLDGATPVLMADGRSRALADLRPGDPIYGTVRRGPYRRYEKTTVLAHWATRKPAYRILLDDGTELVASADHRFLTDRGWKYVQGAESGPMQRPHLTLNNKLMGVGALGPSVAEGIAIKSQAKLGVAAIEPLGREIPMYDITTGTGDFIANGVVSHNCFARRTHTFLDMNAGRDFEREIVVKVNVPELLRGELARPSWQRELVALGTNTDPYQWVESRYRMMPEILEALEAARTPVSVLTKSPLVMRDVKIFKRMAKKKLPVSVNLSVPTLDEEAWRATEPHTPSPAARLDAVAELRRLGIDSGVLIAPLMPGINDHPDQVRPIIERAKKAKATFLGGVALHLRDEVKDVFLAWLEEKRPDLLPRYEALYGDRAYMSPEHRKQATRAVRGWGRNRGPAARAPNPAPDSAGSMPIQPALF
ncbi:MAG TPA: radical SAM protein [Solirubrobacterales bacterium]|nr:radical SAM protein [Solirubrobacterales bacterium]